MEISWNDFREANLAREIDRLAREPEMRKHAAEDRAVIEQCRLERERQESHKVIGRRHAVNMGG